MKFVLAKKSFAAGALAAVLALGACTMHDAPKEQASLYERLGGKPAIEAVVGQFLQNVVADDRINGFFANVDAADLQMKLVDQICEASGGPLNRPRHGDHPQGPGHHRRPSTLVEDLVAALDKFNVPEREERTAGRPRPDEGRHRRQLIRGGSSPPDRREGGPLPGVRLFS
jgi:hemoglobin